MCLFPVDGYQQMLIPPSQRARKLASALRVVIYGHLIVIIGFFLSALYVDGVVDLLGALIGFMAIRNHRGYNFQQVLCYSIYLGMDCFWSIIRSTLFLLGLTKNQVPLTEWQYHIYVITITGSGFFYFIGCIVAWQLYRELRTIFQRIMDEAPPLQIQNQQNAVRGQYQAVPNAHGAAVPRSGSAPAAVSSEVSAAEVGSRQNSDNFTPFSGKKYSLRT